MVAKAKRAVLVALVALGLLAGGGLVEGPSGALAAGRGGPVRRRALDRRGGGRRPPSHPRSPNGV